MKKVAYFTFLLTLAACDQDQCPMSCAECHQLHQDCTHCRVVIQAYARFASHSEQHCIRVYDAVQFEDVSALHYPLLTDSNHQIHEFEQLKLKLAQGGLVSQMLTSFTHQFKYEGVYYFQDSGSEHRTVIRVQKNCLKEEQEVQSSSQHQTLEYKEWLHFVPLFFIVVAFVLVLWLHRLEQDQMQEVSKQTLVVNQLPQQQHSVWSQNIQDLQRLIKANLDEINKMLPESVQDLQQQQQVGRLIDEQIDQLEQSKDKLTTQLEREFIDSMEKFDAQQNQSKQQRDQYRDSLVRQLQAKHKKQVNLKIKRLRAQKQLPDEIKIEKTKELKSLLLKLKEHIQGQKSPEVLQRLAKIDQMVVQYTKKQESVEVQQQMSEIQTILKNI